MKNITDELCPHCGREVEIKKDAISNCPECGILITPCSMCNMDEVDCNECIYDIKQKEGKTKI